MKKNVVEKIKNLGEEIATLLKEENPYTSVIITDNKIRIVEDLCGFPVNKEEK